MWSYGNARSPYSNQTPVMCKAHCKDVSHCKILNFPLSCFFTHFFVWCMSPSNRTTSPRHCTEASWLSDASLAVSSSSKILSQGLKFKFLLCGVGETSFLRMKEWLNRIDFEHRYGDEGGSFFQWPTLKPELSMVKRSSLDCSLYMVVPFPLSRLKVIPYDEISTSCIPYLE